MSAEQTDYGRNEEGSCIDTFTWEDDDAGSENHQINGEGPYGNGSKHQGRCDDNCTQKDAGSQPINVHGVKGV
eukprot:15342226-Ditylum_brightwellii.AAC.1